MLKDHAVIRRTMLKFEKEVVSKADVSVIENLKNGRTRGAANMSFPTTPTTYETSATTTILTTTTTGKS